MKRKILFGVLLITLCLFITGCGKEVVEEETFNYSKEEEKAYAAYEKKTSPNPADVTQDNYAEILLDRFGLDVNTIEMDGYSFGSIVGSSSYTMDDLLITYNWTCVTDDCFNHQYDGVKEATNTASEGKLYNALSGVITSEATTLDQLGTEWFYIFEGRTYGVNTYTYTSDDDASEELHISLFLDKKNTLSNAHSIEVITDDNYARLVKEYYGIDPVYVDPWRFNFTNTSGTFDGSYLSFIVSNTKGDETVEVDEYTSMNKEIPMDEARTDALTLIKKYFEKTSKISKNGNYKYTYNDIYEPVKGKKISKASDLKLNDENKVGWVYEYKGHLIQIDFELYNDTNMYVMFGCSDFR